MDPGLSQEESVPILLYMHLKDQEDIKIFLEYSIQGFSPFSGAGNDLNFVTVPTRCLRSGTNMIQIPYYEKRKCFGK